MAQLVLGRPAETDARSSEFAGLAKLVAGRQKTDGAWKAGGQLPDQRRPEAETHRVSTAWAVLALASVDEPGAALDRGRERRAWLDEDGESHEWLVVRLLYAHRFGDEDRERDLLAELLSEQHNDGAWGWLRGEASDAFATGQSLYALGAPRSVGRRPGGVAGASRPSRHPGGGRLLGGPQHARGRRRRHPDVTVLGHGLGGDWLAEYVVEAYPFRWRFLPH